MINKVQAVFCLPVFFIRKFKTFRILGKLSVKIIQEAVRIKKLAVQLGGLPVEFRDVLEGTDRAA